MKAKSIKITVFLIICVVLAAIITLLTSINNDKFLINVSLYFAKTDSTAIVEEKREITYNESDDLIPKIIKEINKGPLNPDKKRIVKNGVKIKDIFYEEDGHSVIINFNDRFLHEDKSQNLLAAYTVIKSVCCVASVTGITHVKLLVEDKEIETADGKIIGFLSYDDITLSDAKETNPASEVLLYFLNESKDALSAEIREIKLDNVKSIEQNIVEELLKGPKSDKLKKTVSGEIISVETKDGVCFVNFDFSFMEKNINGKPELCIYSIVNSLTELEHIQGVQILIEGKKTDKIGDFDISGVLKRKSA